MNDGCLYTGVTNNLARRQSQHGHASSTRTTRFFGEAPMLYHEEFGDLKSALKREHQIKKWSHAKKIALVHEDLLQLKRLAKRKV